MICTTSFESPIGTIRIVERDGALIGLWFDNQEGFSTEAATDDRDLPVLRQAKNWLERYFSGQMPSASELRLAPEGNEFRKAVWELLCEIPYGKVTTYGEIARKVATKRGLPRMSAQAVGGAIGHNPIPVIIPCHRVVGVGGSLVGFSGGIEKKIALLCHEGHRINQTKMKITV